MADRKRSRRRPSDEPLSLTVKHIRFCQFYADSGNGFESHKLAGLDAKNDKARRQAASSLLTNPDILAYIQELKEDALAAAKITVQRLAHDFDSAVNANITSLFNDDGALPPRKWPKDVQKHIISVEVEDIVDWRDEPTSKNPKRRVKVVVGRKWKVKLENKTECRKILAQWAGMLAKNEDKDSANNQHNPLVVGGEANPDLLRAPKE